MGYDTGTRDNSPSRIDTQKLCGSGASCCADLLHDLRHRSPLLKYKYTIWRKARQTGYQQSWLLPFLAKWPLCGSTEYEPWKVSWRRGVTVPTQVCEIPPKPPPRFHRQGWITKWTPVFTEMSRSAFCHRACDCRLFSFPAESPLFSRCTARPRRVYFCDMEATRVFRCSSQVTGALGSLEEERAPLSWSLRARLRSNFQGATWYCHFRFS